MSETRVVLEGMTVGGKTMREHLEVINHRDAILFVEELAQSGEDLTEWNIRNLHRLILKAIDVRMPACTADYSPFITLVAECADKSLNLWLSMVS